MNDQPPLGPLRSHLMTLAQETLIQLPDLHQLAREAAQRLLASLKVEDDPDSFYWHRFDNSQSSHRSFTGYQHQGPPIESMTFTELLMRRFQPGDQDNADLLHVMGGFYRSEASSGFFNEHNEVRLAPERVLTALWGLDFSRDYRKHMSAFWASHTDSVRVLIRLNCLVAAVQACEALDLTRTQVQWVFDGLGIDQAMALAAGDFSGRHLPRAGIGLRQLRIAGHDLVNVLAFVHPAGGVLLYLAGRSSAFEGFADETALQRWLHAELSHSDTRSALLLRAGWVNPEQAVERGRAFEHLGGQVFGAASHSLQLLPLAGDGGQWLCEQTRQQMAAEAELYLRGNADLRKQLWLGYLGAGLRTFGPVAMVAWPAALLVVVASAAKLALQVDQAVQAPDAAQRQAAVLAAVFSGIELLLNMALLIPASRPVPRQLQALEARPVITAQTAALSGADGVVWLEAGAFIRFEGRFYRVRQDTQLGCWLIVDPERPFAFSGNYPVRLNDQLQWELLDRPCLLGAGQCLGTARVRPTLPDDYAAFQMQTRPYEVPVAARQAVRELYRPEYRNLVQGLGLETGHPLESALATVNRLRSRLIQDSVDFIDQWRAYPQPRSPLLAPDSSLPVPLALQRLLQETRGVVVGESHISTASKRFLIENMALMARNGVDTLYMEHLMSDLHQVWLENIPRNGNLPTRLQDYLRGLDRGHGLSVSSDYTFTTLVQTARRAGIEVRALDCAASYRLDGMEDVFEYVGGTLRQQVFSYYASRVLGTRLAMAGAGKWVALVGNTHALAYKGVPGLAQLQDVMSIRVVDAGAGQATAMTLDPGEFFMPSMGRPDGVVRADWRLAIKVREEPYEFLDPSLAPPGVTRP